MFIDFLAALAVFCALALVAAAVTSRAPSSSAEHRLQLLAGTRRLRTADLPRVSFVHRFMGPLLASGVRGLLAVMPPRWLAWTERKLVTAGRPMSATTFLSVVLVTGTALPAFYFVFLWGGTNGHPGRWGLLVLPFIAMGIVLPVLWLRRRARRRQTRIWRSLPDAFDLVTTCVEAGLSLDAAFQKVALRFKGPFGDEVGQMLREIALGKTRRVALTDLAERLDIPDLSVFATAVIQSEQLGTSLAQTLRVQAAQIRMRRRQRAEQVARQAAVKMSFPLVFCMMPSLFIVILGPVFIQVVHFLQGH